MAIATTETTAVIGIMSHGGHALEKMDVLLFISFFMKISENVDIQTSPL